MKRQNCLCKSISVEEMEDIKTHIPEDETIQKMADFFKVFGIIGYRLSLFLRTSSVGTTDINDGF